MVTLEALARWLAGASGAGWFGMCRRCWTRQDLSHGARCLSCGGVIARIKRA